MDKQQQLIVNRVKVGLIFKAIREESGLSQVDAALKLGYANATFTCNVEKGVSAVPLNKVAEFAEVYGAGDSAVVAGVLIKLAHPDAWEQVGKVYSKFAGNKKVMDRANKEVDKWIADMIKEFNIEF